MGGWGSVGVGAGRCRVAGVGWGQGRCRIVGVGVGVGVREEVWAMGWGRGGGVWG